MYIFKKRKVKSPIVINTECACGVKNTFDCKVLKSDGRTNYEYLCIDCIKVATLNGSFVIF